MQVHVLVRRLLSQFFDLVVGIFADVSEQFLDIGPVLGTDLKKGHPVGISQLPATLSRHLPMLPEVALVPDQEDRSLRTTMLMNLLEPVLNIAERGRGVDGVGQDDDKGPFVKSGGQILEFLLASCVPNLQLDLEFLDLDCF